MSEKIKKTSKIVQTVFKTVLDLAEVIARGFASYVLLTKFDNKLVMAVGIYLAVTALIVLVQKLFKSNK